LLYTKTVVSIGTVAKMPVPLIKKFFPLKSPLMTRVREGVFVVCVVGVLIKIFGDGLNGFVG